ncbi:MAG: Gfo/Idh/MocA family oxidoreductase [FCB group bacterium]|jgi:predicted dehydrogenase|nr:Gfo/Idh/MocA family oxidoreductase [FCB group bacterium]
MDRREFLGKSAALAALGVAGVSLKARGANDRVVVGVMGIHDRGMDLASELAKRPDVEVRYLADPDTRLFEERAATIEDLSGKRPQCVRDFRRMLDDAEVDAIAVATPDHWHAPATVFACQADKDVYVEKPASHSIWEGRKMVEAARKYDRVVQVGTQNRSAPYCYEAAEQVRSEAFGDVHFVRVMNSKLREDIGRKQDGPVPEGVDYDLWLGPASKRPFNENRFHYNWHWFWEYGGGDLANDGLHQIDLARWMTGSGLPKAVSASTGTFHFDDDRETPDTQTVTWEFDKLTIVLEQTLWSPYMKKVPLELRDSGGIPNWPFDGTRVEIYGTKQLMCLGRMGGGFQIFDGDGKSIVAKPGQFAPANTAHIANFVDCVRSRKRPNADIEEGHLSTLYAHYGNIAGRVGRRLLIDPETEGFQDDEGANALVRREYRQAWAIPESV